MCLWLSSVVCGLISRKYTSFFYLRKAIVYIFEFVELKLF